jgi:hypothetical protein
MIRVCQASTKFETCQRRVRWGGPLGVKYLECVFDHSGDLLGKVVSGAQIFTVKTHLTLDNLFN